MMGNAAQAVQQLVATAGEQQGDLAQLKTAHQNAMTLASTSLNNIEQVDTRDRDHPAQHAANPASGVLSDDQRPAIAEPRQLLEIAYKN